MDAALHGVDAAGVSCCSTHKCRLCRVLGEPGWMGNYETKERSNACSGRGQAARGLAGRTVDRETSLQSWVEPQRLACLTEWTVELVPVGGGRGVQAYAVLGVIRVWMYLAGSNQQCTPSAPSNNVHAAGDARRELVDHCPVAAGAPILIDQAYCGGRFRLL